VFLLLEKRALRKVVVGGRKRGPTMVPVVRRAPIDNPFDAKVLRMSPEWTYPRFFARRWGRERIPTNI